MAKKNKTETTTTEQTMSEPKVKRIRGVAINTKLVGFVAQCVRDGLLNQSKQEVIEAYQTAVGVKSPKNIDNIAKRNLRPVVMTTLAESLEQNGLSYDEYVETQKLLVAKIKRKEA